MERSRFLALALVACCALGCSREAPSGNNAAQNPTAGAAAQTHTGSHFVVRPVDPTAPAEQPGSTSPAVGAAPPVDFPTQTPVEPPPIAQPLDPGFSSSDATTDITPVPSPVDEAFNNPLRIGATAPVTAAARVDIANPLRSPPPESLRGPRMTRSSPPIPRMAAPKMAARAIGSPLPPAAAADPPATSPPPTATARESAPMAASAEPQFVPSISGGGAAGGAPLHSAPRAAPAAMGLADFGSTTLPASPPSAFDVVQVFYATDRLAIGDGPENLPQQIARFLPTAIAVLITLALGLVAAGKRRPLVWTLVGIGVLVTLGLGYQAASGTLVAVRQAEHVGPRYTSDRSPGGQVQLGLCEVTIPKTHQIGELEAPSILRLEIKPDADRHVILRKTERLADEPYYELLRARVAASPRKELFVFVHGFNVTFEDAARRTAQIQKDLAYQGAPVFFSWPAHDKFILTYKADEANVSWSAAHLKKFLLDVTRESQAESINLIAHSMGNRALTVALKELQLELRDQSRLFNQVILAAPDIDSDEFRESIVPGMTRTANRFTLYASARDEALAASQLVHRGPRAGDAGRGLVVVPGIDTIDVTQIDTSTFGHTYYGSSDPVLRDLGLLLTRAVPPEQRVWLSPAELDGRPYWVFQPTTAATARAPGNGTGF